MVFFMWTNVCRIKTALKNLVATNTSQRMSNSLYTDFTGVTATKKKIPLYVDYLETRM